MAPDTVNNGAGSLIIKRSLSLFLKIYKYVELFCCCFNDWPGHDRKKSTLTMKYKRTLSLFFYYDDDISNGFILFSTALASKYQIKSNLFFLKVGSRSGSTPPGSATLACIQPCMSEDKKGSSHGECLIIRPVQKFIRNIDDSVALERL